MISILFSLLSSSTILPILSILFSFLLLVLLLSPGLLGDSIGVIGLSTGFLGLLTPWFGTPLITIASILYSTNLVMTGALEGVGIGGPIIAVVTFVGTIGALIADLIPGVNLLFATVWLPLVSFLYPVLFTLLVGKPWQGFIHLVLLSIGSITYWLTGLISPVTGITVFFPFVFFVLVQGVAFALDFNPTTGLSTLLPTMLSAFFSILIPVVGPTTALIPMATVAILGAILLVVFYVVSWPVGLLEAAIGIAAMLPTSTVGITTIFTGAMAIVLLVIYTVQSPTNFTVGFLTPLIAAISGMIPVVGQPTLIASLGSGHTVWALTTLANYFTTVVPLAVLVGGGFFVFVALVSLLELAITTATLAAVSSGILSVSALGVGGAGVSNPLFAIAGASAVGPLVQVVVGGYSLAYVGVNTPLIGAFLVAGFQIAILLALAILLIGAIIYFLIALIPFAFEIPMVGIGNIPGLNTTYNILTFPSATSLALTLFPIWFLPIVFPITRVAASIIFATSQIPLSTFATLGSTVASLSWWPTMSITSTAILAILALLLFSIFGVTSSSTVSLTSMLGSLTAPTLTLTSISVLGILFLSSMTPSLTTSILSSLSTFSASIVPPLTTVLSALSTVLPTSTISPTLSPTLSTALLAALTFALVALVGAPIITFILPWLLETTIFPLFTTSSILPSLSTNLLTLSAVTPSLTLAVGGLLAMTTLPILATTTLPILFTLIQPTLFTSTLVSLGTPTLLLTLSMVTVGVPLLTTILGGLSTLSSLSIPSSTILLTLSSILSTLPTLITPTITTLSSLIPSLLTPTSLSSMLSSMLPTTLTPLFTSSMLPIFSSLLPTTMLPLTSLATTMLAVPPTLSSLGVLIPFLSMLFSVALPLLLLAMAFFLLLMLLSMVASSLAATAKYTPALLAARDAMDSGAAPAIALPPLVASMAPVIPAILGGLLSIPILGQIASLTIPKEFGGVMEIPPLPDNAIDQFYSQLAQMQKSGEQQIEQQEEARQQEEESQRQEEKEQMSGFAGISVPDQITAIIEKVKSVASDFVGVAAPEKSVTIINSGE